MSVQHGATVLEEEGVAEVDEGILNRWWGIHCPPWSVQGEKAATLEAESLPEDLRCYIV